MNNVMFSSPADMGGRKVLGMPGSLNSYIRTGNQFDPRYYQNDRVDLKTKEAKIRKFDNAVTKFVTAASLVLIAIATYNTKFGKKLINKTISKIKTIPHAIKNIPSNIKNASKNNTNNVSSANKNSFFSKARDFVMDKTNKVKNGLDNLYIKVFNRKIK